MSYTTLASVKTSLWITWLSQDAILNQLIADADVYLNKALDITSFEKWTITEKVKFFSQSYSKFGYYMFYLKNFNVSNIKEINGKAYTGVIDVDYQIQNSRVLQIRNLHQYFVPTYFDYMTIKYDYGYDRSPTPPLTDELPDDIKLLARLLVKWLYNELYPMGYNATTNGQQNMQKLTSYSLWDESMSWDIWLWSLVSWKKEEERSMFKQLFMKYKKQPNAIR